jgi:membrane associated rhomboid family serine protease
LETIDAKTARNMPEPEFAPPPKPEAVPATKAQPVFNVPTVVFAVLGVLIAVHAVFWALGENWQIWSSFALAFIPSRLGGGEPIPALPGSQIWTFFTYALLHADVYHLGSNCIWMLIFSTPVARRLGWWRYLVLLLVSAAAGAAAMLPLHWGEFLRVVGASASVSAVLAAAIPLMFAKGFRLGGRQDVDYQRLEVLHPRDLFRNAGAVAFGLMFVAITALTAGSMAFSGTAFLEETSVAWEAHLGGFIAGFLLFYLLDKSVVSHRPNQ